MSTQTKKRGAVEELSALEWHALKTVGRKHADKLRERLEIADATPVDVTVRITGSMSVAGDAVSVGGKSPSAKVLLAIALAALGPANREKVTEAVTKACKEWMDGGDEPKPSTADLLRADDLMLAVTREEEIRRSGNVTGVLAVEVLERG